MQFMILMDRSLEEVLDFLWQTQQRFCLQDKQTVLSKHRGMHTSVLACATARSKSLIQIITFQPPQ